MTLAKRIRTFGLTLVSVLTVIAYMPGLNGPFVFDDIVNITENPVIKINDISFQGLSAFASFEDGLTPNRILAKISFALNYFMAGKDFDAYIFKITNLAIHLINTWFVYWLVVLLSRQLNNQNKYSLENKYIYWFPLFTASIWAIHPLQLTSVLYVVQRMTSLSALFVLMGLITSILGRQRIQENRPSGALMMSGGLIGGVVLGSACKENAVLLPLFMLLIEWLFFEKTALEKKTRNKLWWIYGLILAPYMLGLAWVTANPGIILDSYAVREFTLIERILTEPRALWYYIGLLFIPSLSELSLFHDDIALSTSLVSPWTTIVALAFLLASVVLSISCRKRAPVLSFAILWYLLGHSIESSVVGLEIAHEHRNYLPSIGPIIGLSYGLMLFYGRIRGVLMPILFSIALFSVLFVSTYLRAGTWQSEESIIQSMARHHPVSSRSHFMLGELYAEKGNEPSKALIHYYKAYALAPHEAGYLIRIAMRALSMNTLAVSSAVTDGFDVLPMPAPELPAPIVIEKSKDAVKVLLNREYSIFVSNQLKLRSPTENTQQIMFGLSRCLTDEIEICQKALPDIIEWYKAVLANPYLNNKVRKDYIISLFEIGITSRNYNLAIDAAKHGIAADPSDPDYTLMEANVYILQDKTDIAEKLIYSVTSSGNDIDDDISSKARTLLSVINARKKKIEKEDICSHAVCQK